MFVKTHIHKQTYRDSIYLMRLSSIIRGLDGVEEAEVIVGTEHNKKFLKTGGLWTEHIEEEAGPNDLIIAVKAKEEQKAEEAIAYALKELNKETKLESAGSEFYPRTFEMALKQMPGANMAVVSIPGRYVEREVNKILDSGLHVMIFSDNVPLEVEVSLKKKARERGLLVMGPDCGTAIINGVPLAFANEVRRGAIGVVAAAGTGMQEVTSLIHNYGEGISQGIGTGGRDVKAAVGGITMIQGLQALMEDPQTKVIVIVSKPPEQSVAEKVLRVASQSTKPVVVNFIGGDASQVRNFGCEPASTLREAADKAVSLLRGKKRDICCRFFRLRNLAGEEKQKLAEKQRFLRGLFSGGTLAYESIAILQDAVGGIYSNISLDKNFALEDVYKSKGHTIIDLGDDEFTQGRPHPMIDPTIRNHRIIAEAKDPETAVIMLDVVLGYGAHQDPAGAALEAIKKAKKIALEDGRNIVFVASVCGTDKDIQNREEQIKKLEQEEVLVFASNADAAMFVKELLV